MVNFSNLHVYLWKILVWKPFPVFLYLVPLTFFLVYHFKTFNYQITNRKYIQSRHRLSHRESQRMNTEEICKSAIHHSNSACLGYSLNNPTICKDENNILTLMLVYSAAKHFKNRERLRQTVGNQSILPMSVRIVFIIGVDEGASLQKQIVEEHNLHRDTVQGKFVDNLKNSTLKIFIGLKWATEYCQNVEFVIKMDDDVTADMFYLLVVTLPPFIGTEQTLICDGEKGTLTYHYKNNNWYSDPHGKDNPRKTCVAQAFIMTSDLVPILYEARNPRIWNGDVFSQGEPDLKNDRLCSEEREAPCLFAKGEEHVLAKFWISAYKRRYDFIAEAFDNLEIIEGF